jgi:hypothetical protein
VRRSRQATVASCYFAMCFESSIFMKSYISINIWFNATAGRQHRYREAYRWWASKGGGDR